MLRFGSVKCGKTAFSLLAVALALQYLCIRICCTREIESKLSFLSFAISLYKICFGSAVSSPVKLRFPSLPLLSPCNIFV
jgi:hypothetical protein